MEFLESRNLEFLVFDVFGVSLSSLLYQTGSMAHGHTLPSADLFGEGDATFRNVKRHKSLIKIQQQRVMLFRNFV